MQTLKLKVSVRNHHIAEPLPPQIPDGDAEVIIQYQEHSPESIAEVQRRYLEAWFARVREHSPNRTREDIDRQLAEERASWGE